MSQMGEALEQVGRYLAAPDAKASATGPGPRPIPAPGQTWMHRDRRRSPVTVLAVDRASVWTDQGRTTVFRLLRDRRLIEPATSHHA